MKNDNAPNPWQVLSAVSQRISQGFGVKSNLRSGSQSDLTSVQAFKAKYSLEEVSRRTVEGQLAGADIKPISGWLRHSEYSQLTKLQQVEKMAGRPNMPP